MGHGNDPEVVADAIATYGKFDGFLCQYGTVGVINAMMDAKHPLVPSRATRRTAS